MERVRDRMWIWGHEAGSYVNDFGVTLPSRMTQVEGAYYLGVSNVLMVEMKGLPAPPFRQHAIALRPCKQVVWSVVGAVPPGDIGENHPAVSSIDDIIGLASEFPNITGVMLDDYFTLTDEQGRRCLPRATLDQLKGYRQACRSIDPPLDLWVVVYDSQIADVPQEHLELCDVINFWTWEANNLQNLESNLAALKARYPHKRVVLGCYMWDFGGEKPMPLDLMEHQCETGLKWLREGQIEGMVFLASCICDMDLDAVEWSRAWIARIGDQMI